MSRFAATICTVMLVGLAGGCATALRGDKQKMKFSTDPSGATISLNGEKYTTPHTAKLKRNQGYDVVLTKDGYQPIAFRFGARWDGLAMIDAPLPGGSAMLAADHVSGAAWSFPTLQTIKLTPLPPNAPPTTQPMQMYHLRGKVMDKADYEVALKKERERFQTDHR